MRGIEGFRRLGVVTLALLASCTGDAREAVTPSPSVSTPSASETVAPLTPLRPAAVSPAVLELDDMKAGWSSNPLEVGKGRPGFAVCGRKPYRGNLPVFEVSRILDGPGERHVWHTIRPYGSASKASRLMARWEGTAEACKAYRDEEEDRNYNVRRISFKRIGDEVAAVEIKGGRTSEYTSYVFYYVLVRQGQFVSAFRLGVGEQFEFVRGFESDIQEAVRIVELGTEKLEAVIDLRDEYDPVFKRKDAR